MHMPPRFLFFLAGPGVVLIATGCSPTATLTSSPRTSPVAIDGSERDWQAC